MAELREKHPAHGGARAARWLRGLGRFRGWQRAAGWLVPDDATGAFTVENDGVWFEGDLASYIERQVYVLGGYESPLIALFLELIASGKGKSFLDVGANVGTHSVTLARQFCHVYAFEPNPEVLPSLKRNIALNGATNITVVEAGLSDGNGEQPFFVPAGGNKGMGTFSTVEQYDVAVAPLGRLHVERGDDVVARLGIEDVGAVKIDVQGLEPAVLRGLRETLARDRPVVWFECGDATRDQLRTLADVRAHFPYGIAVFRAGAGGLSTRQKAIAAPEGVLQSGEYFVVPRGGN